MAFCVPHVILQLLRNLLQVEFSSNSIGTYATSSPLEKFAYSYNDWHKNLGLINSQPKRYILLLFPPTVCTFIGFVIFWVFKTYNFCFKGMFLAKDICKNATNNLAFRALLASYISEWQIVERWCGFKTQDRIICL